MERRTRVDAARKLGDATDSWQGQSTDLYDEDGHILSALCIFDIQRNGKAKDGHVAMFAHDDDGTCIHVNLDRAQAIALIKALSAVL
jgi:hypothetical protein